MVILICTEMVNLLCTENSCTKVGTLAVWQSRTPKQPSRSTSDPLQSGPRRTGGAAMPQDCTPQQCHCHGTGPPLWQTLLKKAGEIPVREKRLPKNSTTTSNLITASQVVGSLTASQKVEDLICRSRRKRGGIGVSCTPFFPGPFPGKPRQVRRTFSPAPCLQHARVVA
jgi:hypothetical protein